MPKTEINKLETIIRSDRTRRQSRPGSVMANATTKSTGGIELDLDLGALGRGAVAPPLLGHRSDTRSSVRWRLSRSIWRRPRFKSEARVLIEGRENVFLRPDAEKEPE